MPRSLRLVHVSAAALCLATLVSCGDPSDPPSAPDHAVGLRVPTSSISSGAALAPAPTSIVQERTTSREVTFPEELASIATETSIYDEPRWGSHRLGYLRAGSIVRRAATPAENGSHCPEGWYAIEPRGFTCVGPMATLDVHHPIVLAASHPPDKTGLPWLYVLSRAPTPLLYARLPSHAEQVRLEPDLGEHLMSEGPPAGLPAAEPAPSLLTSPDGRVLLGRARPRSGFAVLTTMDHDRRRFGLTAELEVIPLDRTRMSVRSQFAGLALPSGVGLPVAFVKRTGAFSVVEHGDVLTPGPALGYRAAIPVTDVVREIAGSKYHVARDGSLVRADLVILAKPMKRLPAWATDTTKWIEVSIPRQTLVAYEGATPVYVTLVSTGVGGTGDPQETHATIQGAFKIYEKHVTVTMAGREAADPFDLRDVPFVQYFHEGFALHAAYWHDDFGRMKSHGCVNLSPIDAAWLFAWTDPRVPPGWHGTMAREGTIVFVHG